MGKRRTSRTRAFTNVMTVRPKKSAFDLSHSKLFTGDMGVIYPVCADEVMPGDILKVGCEAVIRMQPLVSPVLHEINVFTWYFFVPYRLLNTDTFEWVPFITGDEDGDDASVLPRWDPTDYAVGSLWDHLDFPPTIKPTGTLPMAFPLMAYNMVWNEFFRDEMIQDEVDLMQENLLYAAWEKDYYSSARLDQQLGTAPSIPITGSASAVWTNANIGASLTGAQTVMASTSVADNRLDVSTPGTYGRANLLGAFNANSIDLSNLVTFDVADMRYIFQVQKWMELNQRAGVRYPEFLYAQFGETIPDSTVQRPVYIGGAKSPIIISEVAQTSRTDAGESPQGTLAGKGVQVNQQFCGSFHAKEFGVLIGLMCIKPRTMYSQGINRQWLRVNRLEFPFPLFANLSEQPILQAEIFTSTVEAENKTIFGYVGQYDECRYKPNTIAGLMRTDFDFWHLARIFSSAPTLDDTFLKCNPDKRIFAVPSEPGFVIHHGNLIKAIRPIPQIAAPGLIDH